jgi:hypothetical protein
MELALAKPIEVSKKVRPSDVAASSQGPHAMGATMTRAARVPVFDNLGDDSSPDVHKTTSPTMMIGKCTSPPPSVSGELCLLGSYFLLRARQVLLQILPGLRPHSICHSGILTKTRNTAFIAYVLARLLFCCACFDRIFYFIGACVVIKMA